MVMNINTTLPQPEELTQLHAEICHALADTRRILIIYCLSDGVHTVNDLSSKLNISQPATSRHLKVLRDRGLVRATRKGSTMEYVLSDYRLVEALNLLRQVLRDQIEHRISLLDQQLVE